MRKKLPLGEPPIKCFLYDAYQLSILSVKEDYRPWLYSNYIQLCCNKKIYNNGIPFLEFFESNQELQNPFLRTQSLAWGSFVKNDINIIDYIITGINDGYYFYSFADEYYMPNRFFYGKHHFIHDIFVFGYDDEKKEFQILGYDDKEQLATSAVSYSAFRDAFLSKADNLRQLWNDRIYLFRYNDEAKYRFDIQAVIELIEDYLNSSNSDMRYRYFHNPTNEKVFGIKIYDSLIYYYQLLSADQVKYDARIPFLLWEHKKCMKDRIDYLIKVEKYQNLEYCYETYEKLETEAKTLLSIMLVYKYKKNSSYLSKIIDILQQIRTEEIEILKKMLSELRKPLDVGCMQHFKM